MKQNISVLSYLDLTCTSNKPIYDAIRMKKWVHFHGSLRSKVSLENLLETLGGVNVNSQSLRSSENVCFSI